MVKGREVSREGRTLKSHKDLDVWKAAIQMAKNIYSLTSKFPKDEMFGMTAQMRRCSVSIASNLAEGAARQGDKEFIQFLHVALGSVAELETQLIIAGEVNLGDPSVLKSIDEDLIRIRQMLRGLAYSLKAAK
jgi:four helix bundle protein